MKSVKVLVLTFFLAVTGYSYGSGAIQASSGNNHGQTTESKACRTAKAECCKPRAECCKAGAPCCKPETNCCEKDKQCCNGDLGCQTADTARAECCATHAGFCTEADKADKAAAETDGKRCCGSACKTGAAKK